MSRVSLNSRGANCRFLHAGSTTSVPGAFVVELCQASPHQLHLFHDRLIYLIRLKSGLRSWPLHARRILPFQVQLTSNVRFNLLS
jgi:hypothetical protein